MGKINIDEVEIGMVLAGPVKDHRGMILLGSGNIITEKHLRTFQMWGIHELDIEGHDKEEMAAKSMSEIDDSILKEIDEEMKFLFMHTNTGHPFIKELERYCKIQLAREKLKGTENEN